MAASVAIGTLGSVAGDRGLALLRLDRAGGARGQGRGADAPARVAVAHRAPATGRIRACAGRSEPRRHDPARAAGIERCPWAGADAEYQRYHDEEWGVPRRATTARCSRSWCWRVSRPGCRGSPSCASATNFRRGVSTASTPRGSRATRAKDVARLMADAGIIATAPRSKRRSTMPRPICASSERTSLREFLWDFLDGEPVINARRTMATSRPQTELSKRISKALKKEGFRFVGPTTVYAFMQSSGMVNDHLVDCHRHAPCAKLQRASVSSRRHEASCADAPAPDRHAAPRAWQRMLSGRRLDLLDPSPARHRDRGHRPRARARRALERADARRARLLGRAALAARRGDRRRAQSGLASEAGASRRCCTMRPSTSSAT